MSFNKKIFTLLAALTLLAGCSVRETLPPEPTPEPTPEFTIMDEAVEMVPGAFEIPCEEMTGEYITIRNFDGDLLFLSNADMQQRLTVLNAVTGEVIARRSFEMSELYYECQVQGDHLVLSCYEKGGMLVLDKNLETVREIPEIKRAGYKYMDSSLENIYVADYEGDIHVIDADTMEEHDLGLGEVMAYASQCSGDKMYFTFSDRDRLRRECGVLDMATGKITINPTGEMVYALQERNGLWFGVASSGMNVCYMFDGESSIKMTKPDNMLLSLDEATGRLLGTGWEGDVYLYNLSGRCISSAVIDGYYICGEPIYNEYWDGYFISMSAYETDDNKLIFWDTSSPGTGRPIIFSNPHPSSPVGQIETLKPLYEKAEEMSRKYGISVRIADQCDVMYQNFYADILTDYYSISNALEMADYVLGTLPDGFIAQLICGDTDEIIMYFTGSLYTTNEDYGTDTYVGFVDFENEKCKIVLDGSVLNSGTIIHELAHVIDNRLNLAEYHWTDSEFSEHDWLSYQPDGFEYGYDYASYDLIVDWDYFIDGYATTFPKEDRARVLEYAADGMTFWFDGHEGLCRKLDYYSRCIRSSFDTTGWPEYTPWEQMLANVGWR